MGEKADFVGATAVAMLCAIQANSVVIKANFIAPHANSIATEVAPTRTILGGAS